MEYDIHTILDGMTLVATSGVLYALWFTPIKSTYQADLDNVKFYYVVRGCCSNSSSLRYCNIWHQCWVFAAAAAAA
jgi:hypothetical protein